MRKWKQKVSLLTRLKFAWKAFWLQSVEMRNWRPYEAQAELNQDSSCDIHGCKSVHTKCLSRTDLLLTVEADRIDHLHVCDDHAAKIAGKVEKYGGFDRFGFDQ